MLAAVVPAGRLSVVVAATACVSTAGGATGVRVGCCTGAGVVTAVGGAVVVGAAVTVAQDSKQQQQQQ
eukprot:13746-Heterococcus_DN1.PRE.1